MLSLSSLNNSWSKDSWIMPSYMNLHLWLWVHLWMRAGTIVLSFVFIYVIYLLMYFIYGGKGLERHTIYNSEKNPTQIDLSFQACICIHEEREKKKKRIFSPIHTNTLTGHRKSEELIKPKNNNILTIRAGTFRLKRIYRLTF